MLNSEVSSETFSAFVGEHEARPVLIDGVDGLGVGTGDAGDAMAESFDNAFEVHGDHRLVLDDEDAGALKDPPGQEQAHPFALREAPASFANHLHHACGHLFDERT